MKKFLGIISCFLIVGLLFVSCGKKETVKDEPKQVQEAKKEDVKHDEEKITKTVEAYFSSLKIGDFDAMKECTLKDSTAYKKVRIMGTSDALYMLGYDKATQVNLEEADMLKMLGAIGKHTTVTVKEITKDKEKATVKIVINEPKYDEINSDGGLEEFLNSKGIDASELSFMPYEDYTSLLKGYVIWFEDIKLPSLEKTDVEKTVYMVKAENKWYIEKIE
ncbi:MAG: hypothetical protein E7391_08920 [Ruminococcaceae bacterium]|nr:hypothetical protein [Oscillospiraceae bacterium]